MRLLDGELVCSPSDLTGFAACLHLTSLEQRAAAGEFDRPRQDDPLLEVRARHGGLHEAEVLADYEDGTRSLTKIDPDTGSRSGLERAAAETVEAMRAGIEVIYQATFLAGGWIGHADFLD